MLKLDFLPEEARACAIQMGDRLCEIRLRRGAPIQLVSIEGEEILFAPAEQSEFTEVVMNLMGYSLYAREDELLDGFLTLQDGSRAGISGHFRGKTHSIGDIGDISSVCIRVARQILGCADGVMDRLRHAHGALIISPPGMGKTTLLRDIVRQLSGDGKCIALIDERGELAACKKGVPTLDVGPRTDVYSMCPKSRAIMLAIRAMAPDVIAADEIGAQGDAEAIREAARCGVEILTTAHGDSLDSKNMRMGIGNLISDGIFEVGILMGPGRGQILEIRKF